VAERLRDELARLRLEVFRRLDVDRFRLAVERLRPAAERFAVERFAVERFLLAVLRLRPAVERFAVDRFLLIVERFRLVLERFAVERFREDVLRARVEAVRLREDVLRFRPELARAARTELLRRAGARVGRALCVWVSDPSSVTDMRLSSKTIPTSVVEENPTMIPFSKRSLVKLHFGRSNSRVHISSFSFHFCLQSLALPRERNQAP
jgi:hypothetical protein